MYSQISLGLSLEEVIVPEVINTSMCFVCLR